MSGKQLNHEAVIVGLSGKFTPEGAAVSAADGIPRQNFVKDLLRVGKFFKRGTADGYQFDRTTLDHWADSVKRFIAAGNSIPVPNGHDTTGNADRNRGYLLDAWVENDTLMGKFEMIGTDGIAAANRSHVSIYSPPKHVDGNGTEWTMPITHVALTTDPVVNGQGRFVPVAASHGVAPHDVPILTPDQKGNAMDLKALAAKMGIKTELTNDNAVEVIASHFATVTTERDNAVALANSDDKGAKLNDMQAANDRLKGEVTSLSNQVKQLKPVQMGRDGLMYAKNSIDGEIEYLLSNGKITPAVADKIRPVLADGAFMLSMETRDSGASMPRSLELLKALRENDPIELAEKTKAQTVSLSRQSPDAKEAKHDPKVTDEMAAMAGGAAK